LSRERLEIGEDDLVKRARRYLADPFHDLDIIGVPFVSGAGATVWDVTGKRYIDYTMSKGALILGHADPQVNGAVSAFLKDGANLMFSGPFHERHVRLAESLCRIIPCAEKVRFFKTGSCATTAAVRLTRLVTGGDLVLTSGYHGWHDWALQGMKSTAPEGAAAINFAFDLDRLRMLLRKHVGRVACIFVTPEPNFFDPKLLQEMRSIADEAMVPLVFDEVKTGFRFSVGGYQRHIGVTPDLATFSKGLANGFSLSALAGRAAFMDAAARTDLESTYQLELACFVAAEATLRILQSEPVIERIWAQGAKLITGLTGLFERQGVAACIYTHPPMFHIVFEEPEEARLFHTLSFERGVLTYPFDNQMIAPVHDDAIIHESLNRFEDAVSALRRVTPHRGARRRLSSRGSRVSRNALDRYTMFEFGGAITNYGVGEQRVG
jgi:glutamate-1-semialdehyde 2,1-aminomutase